MLAALLIRPYSNSKFAERFLYYDKSPNNWIRMCSVNESGATHLQQGLPLRLGGGSLLSPKSTDLHKTKA